MKYTLVFLVVSIFNIGCESPSEPYHDNQIDDMKIKGEVFNYQDGYEKVHYYIGTLNKVFDSTTINATGDFELILKKPDSTYLRRYSYQDGQSGGMIYRDSVNFSNPNIKFINYIFSLSKENGLKIVIDNAKRKEEFGYPTIGDYFIMYYYSNGESFVNGAFESKIITTGYKVITKYNLKVQRGWNKISSRLIQRDDIKEVYEITEADSIPADWVLVGGSSFFSKSL